MSRINNIQDDMFKLINKLEINFIKINDMFKEMYDLKNRIHFWTDNEVSFEIPQNLYSEVLKSYIENKTDYNNILQKIKDEIKLQSENKEIVDKLCEALYWLKNVDTDSVFTDEDILKDFRLAYKILC